ncbi:NAD(P)/FAD-dependent oxidoreductase [uncultured Mucilaginibacter sp.]|uniref:flavin monoamine oxidase family protein n=1 Tax=uncultured Mucilaginibacter sp. TaxID=797541 RepID=UPI0026042235|nr:NAD(P)/FAD-dependent oxidoreductase [uncultured Mucilaginibacter sp.]
MDQADTIIIGAGAAGLITAYELTKAGQKVIVLEARNRIGGRCFTFSGDEFITPVELGAEFIHGELPLTLKLLKEAQIKYEAVSGESFQSKNGEIVKSEFFTENWDAFEKALLEVQEDQSLETFLQQHFHEEKFAGLRKSIQQFAAGYDTADPARVSLFSLRDEWLGGHKEETQFRIPGGYIQLMDYLAKQVQDLGSEVHLEKMVRQVNWQPNSVEVIANQHASFTGKKLVLTVPLGVLTLSGNETGAITFDPDLPKQRKAATEMGFGAIIKILMEFADPFWKKQGLNNMQFLFSEEKIPTWWTQNPQQNNVLTGWLGGKPQDGMQHLSDEELLQEALISPAHIVNADASFIEQKLVAAKVYNWTADPFARGSYSYATLQTASALKILKTPVAQTIYFAGEALFEGEQLGTVEAALVSGLEVAKTIIGA